MKLLLVVAVLAASLATGYGNKAISRTAVRTLPMGYTREMWFTSLKGKPEFNYNCTALDDGNYPHPSLCTHYVACVAQKYAYEMPCALGNDLNLLQYVKDSGPDPETSRCDRPEVVGCTGPTPPPPEPEPTTPSPGGPKPCDPLDCWNEGYCRNYTVCHNGESHSGQCEDNLWWNPHDWVEGHITGQCDKWENLSEETQNEYQSDENCIPPCDWWGVGGACSPNYIFRAPFKGDINGRESELTCSANLVWSDASHNCVHCKSAQNENGGACC